jgi:hypothetical protein
MRVQFQTMQLLRCVGFFAFAVWTLTWVRAYPHMLHYVLFFAPAAFGGAIGALFGKTPHGVFAGLAFTVLVLFAGFASLLVFGLPID